MIGDPGGRSEERNLLDARHARPQHRVPSRRSSRRFLDFEPGPCQAAWSTTRLDRADRRARFPARRRQAFLRQPHGRQGVGAQPHGRASTASGSPSSATCCCRPTITACLHEHMLRAPNRRQRPVGQHHRRHRPHPEERRRTVHGLTLPLITNADGRSSARPQSGAIWLDPARTSPYALYQYFVNLPDADVEPYLLQLTLMSVEEARGVAAAHARAPERRAGQQRLAWEMCALSTRSGCRPSPARCHHSRRSSAR